MEANVKIPAKRRNNHFKFNSHHITTMSFGSISPVFKRIVFPGDKINLKTSVFARVAPMAQPTFGDVRLHQRAYFVPWSACWSHWNDFYDGMMTSMPDGRSFFRFERVPYCTTATLRELFLSKEIHVSGYPAEALVEEVQDGDPNDFSVWTPASGQVAAHINYYKFTTAGKRLYQIFQALGYNFTWCPTGNQNGVEVDSLKFNLLPFLAFCELFFQNFVPNQYKQGHPYVGFKQYLHNYIQDPLLNAQDLEPLVNMFLLAYQSDYFTSAWTGVNTNGYHYGPTDGLSTDASGGTQTNSIVESGGDSHQDLDYGQVRVVTDADENSASYAGFMPWALSLAQKLQSWFTRLALTGYEHADHILSEFGVKPIEKVGVSRYLGTSDTQLKISDVTDTSSTGLGQYVGKGQIYDVSKGFQCEVREHGIVIVVATIEPVSSFCRGIDRDCLDVERLDMFNPTYDGMNMQVLSKAEFVEPVYYDSKEMRDKRRSLLLSLNTGLGFVPRYAHHKYPKNRVTGDFNINRFRTSLKSFSLERHLLNDAWESDEDRLYLNSGADYLSLKSIQFESDANQFNRIFQDTDGEADPFFCIFEFELDLSSKLLPMRESYQQYESNDNVISVDKNGAYSN